MSEPNRPRQTQDLLKGLLGEFSAPGAAPTSRSLGVVGPGAAPAQPPAHCLRSCLGRDPGSVEPRGCPWLRRAAAGRLDTTCLDNGRCPRGFSVAGQPIRLNGRTGFLLTIEEAANDAAGKEATGDVTTGIPLRLEGLSHVFEQVSQLLDENEGLANEVLRSYEQLNLLFDFTQRIASLTDVNAIEKVLLVRLGGLLTARNMLVVGPDGQQRYYDVERDELISAGDASPPVRELTREIEAVRQTRTVAVCSSPVGRVLLGPLVRLDDKVHTVLAFRSPDADDFTSGDMLVLESVLAFGGQIISNSEVHERLHRMSFESTRALVAAIDKKDHYTSGHSERVGYWARLTSARLGMSAAEQKLVEMAGLLHDVGKIGVPEEILCKPGKLTNEEFGIIKKHPVMGYDILKPIASFGGVLDGVLYHHENPDGSGYPEGLRGDGIPLIARIIHVVDVFDALTSTRSYRAAFSIEQACKIVREEAGTKLDAEVAAVFLDLLPGLRTTHPQEFAALFWAEREAAHAEA